MAGMSDIVVWGGIAGLVVSFGTIGTWVWSLATKLAVTHAKAQAAEILAAGASGKTSTLERELADHKEHVAAEYVSRDALKEVTAAINRLGDRLDNLFTQLMTKQ